MRDTDTLGGSGLSASDGRSGDASTLRIGLASLHPRFLSGQIRGLVDLAGELHKLGHGVQVVWPFGEGPSDYRDGLVADQNERDDFSLFGAIPRMARVMRQVESMAKNVDVIHLNLPTPAFTPLANWLHGRVEVPVVVGFEAHLVNAVDLLRHGRLRQDFKFYLPRLVVNNWLIPRWLDHACPRYVVSSRFQARDLRTLGIENHRIHVIPNVVNHVKRAAVDRIECKRRMDLPTEVPLVSYLGHFNHVKGVDILVRAFAEVAERFPEAKLVLAWSGIGDQRPILRLLRALGLEHKTVWMGIVDPADLLAASDVLVLPYRLSMGQSTFPAALIETMRVGVPLVTTDLSVVRELLQPEESALLVPPEDIPALAKAICRLLADCHLGEQLAIRQRSVAHDKLNPSALARQYVGVYEEALDK